MALLKRSSPIQYVLDAGENRIQLSGLVTVPDVIRETLCLGRPVTDIHYGDCGCFPSAPSTRFACAFLSSVDAGLSEQSSWLATVSSDPCLGTSK